MNIDWRIRPAAAPDAAGIVALNARMAADTAHFLAYDIDPASGADMLQAKLGRGEGGDAILVAVAGEAVLGAALLRRHLHPAFEGVLQLGVSADPDRRRQGIGSALIAAALQAAAAARARRVQLAVVDGNAAALALFRAAGFVEEGRLVGAALIDGVARDVIAMARAP